MRNQTSQGQRCSRCYPDRGLILLGAGWTVLGLATLWDAALLPLWLALGGGLLVLATATWYRLSRCPLPTVERLTNSILPVGVWSTITLRFYNTKRQPLTLTIFDHHPQPGQVRHMPRVLKLAPYSWTELHYQLRLLERGNAHFGAVQVLLASRWRLWQRSVMLGSPEAVKVYPNFAAISRYAALAAAHRTTALGIHKRRRRGEGQSFFQLRDYRIGDSLRQIDWKATARRRLLIAKEYQDERNQTLIFLLDTGRRMRAQDGDLSHFDHALNAVILLAYVALRQGDAVGFLSFGGEQRWIAPRQGKRTLTALIGSLYDLQPTLRPPDFEMAAQQLLARQRKRALVVLLSNLGDEDNDAATAALRLLSKHHLVLLANLREKTLDEVLQRPIENHDDALLYGATCHYLVNRARCERRIQHQGGLILDTSPQQLPVKLVNQYIAIKQRGQL